MNRRSFFKRTLGAIASAVITPVLAKTLKVAPSLSPYVFKFTGFKPAVGGDAVVGQIMYMANLQVRSPRLTKQIYGITDPDVPEAVRPDQLPNFPTFRVRDTG